MLVTDQGKIIRTTVGDIRIMGRNTQGVTIFRSATAKMSSASQDRRERGRGDRGRRRRRIAIDDGAVVGESELDKPVPRTTANNGNGGRPGGVASIEP